MQNIFVGYIGRLAIKMGQASLFGNKRKAKFLAVKLKIFLNLYKLIYSND